MIVPPTLAVGASTATVGSVVVTVPLVAISVYCALKKRAWNVPGVAGSRNVTAALVNPVAGIVCVPFRYRHQMLLPFAS